MASACAAGRRRSRRRRPSPTGPAPTSPPGSAVPRCRRRRSKPLPPEGEAESRRRRDRVRGEPQLFRKVGAATLIRPRVPRGHLLPSREKEAPSSAPEDPLLAPLRQVDGGPERIVACPLHAGEI